MLGRVKVLGRVFVLGLITAADMPANEADAQVHPTVAGLQAVLAALRAGGDIPDLIEV